MKLEEYLEQPQIRAHKSTEDQPTCVNIKQIAEQEELNEQEQLQKFNKKFAAANGDEDGNHHQVANIAIKPLSASADSMVDNSLEK